jgi:hypothetical protein
MLKITQWVKTPPGASGSLRINAKLFVANGGSLQLSGGEVLSPWHVYFCGMIAPSANAGLVIAIVD